MKSLYIETNHGFISLSDVSIVETYHPHTDWREIDGTYKRDLTRTWRVIEGTVVDGVETSRLFWARSSTREKVGVTKRLDIYGYTPRCLDVETDSWRLSMVSCG